MFSQRKGKIKNNAHLCEVFKGKIKFLLLKLHKNDKWKLKKQEMNFPEFTIDIASSQMKQENLAGLKLSKENTNFFHKITNQKVIKFLISNLLK